MANALLRIFLFILLLSSTLALADTTSEGWSWGVGCDGEGTFGNSNFSASNSGGFSGGGTCARTSTYFTQFVFTSSSGATLASSTIYALHTGDILIVPPTLSTDVEPTYMVAPNCPVADQALNWIFVQWDSTTNPLTNFYLLGTAGYSTSTGINVSTEYDVSGALTWIGAAPMTGSCSGGIYTSSVVGSSELNGTVYFTTTGAGVYKTNPGHATFFFPQYYTTPATDLGGQSAPGMTFDTQAASHTRQVLVTTDSTGTVFTVKPYLDPNAGTTDGSYTDVITISHVNSPQNGMLIGNVTRTGVGAGSGKIACIVNKDFDFRVFCTGQSPANNQYPYNTTFVVQTSCPANYVRVPKNPVVGTNDDFCVAKYEMGNDGSGNAISSMTANQWTDIIRGNGDGDGGAIDKCQAIGPGYDLITNAEWQTVAQEVETAYSSGSYLNWSNGSNSGSNYLNMGNTGLDGFYFYGVSHSGLVADLDSNPCSGLPLHTNCADNTSDDWAYKRTFELSNGNIVWDFSGNDFTWAKDNNTTNQGGSGYASQAPWSGGGQNQWGPAGNYSAMNSGNYGGFGYESLGSSSGAIIRGGGWESGSYSGVFAANLTLAPSFGYSGDDTGFRCTWHPTAPNATGPTASTITDSGISLSWSSSGGTTDGYQIAYTTGSTPPTSCYSDNVISASTIGNATSYTIPGLTASTQYSFLVCALSAAGGLSSGVSVTATTAAPSGPLVSIAVTPNTATLVSGNSQQMVATGIYADSSHENLTSSVTWSSVDGAGTMSINGSGLVTSTVGHVDSILVTATLGSVSGSTTIGAGTSGYVTNFVGIDATDGGNPLAAGFDFTQTGGVGTDSSGNLYIADTNNILVQMVPRTSGTYFGRIMTANKIYTIAGNGTDNYTGDNGPATSATFGYPSTVAIDPSGNAYISDPYNEAVRMVANKSGTYMGISATAGYIYTVVGNGGEGYNGDSQPATSAAIDPHAVAVDSSGNLYIADGYGSERIRMVPATSGSYFGQSMSANYIYTVISGVDPLGVAVDSSKNVFIADYTNIIEMVPSSAGTYFGQSMAANSLYTIAGIADMAGHGASGALATTVQIDISDWGGNIVADPSGNVFIAEGWNNVTRMVPINGGNYYGQSMSAGYIYSVAGDGSWVDSGDGGPATSAAVAYPQDVAVDLSGNLYIADGDDYSIRMVAATTATQFGRSMTAFDVYTIAGGGPGAFAGDNGPATGAAMRGTGGLAVDSSGNVYVVDGGNLRIRMVAGNTASFFGVSMTAGDIYTVAGGGGYGYTGDGGAATNATFAGINSVTADSLGNFYVVNWSFFYGNYIRMVVAVSGSYFGQSLTAGDIYTIAGGGGYGYTGDGGPATSATTYLAQGVAADSSGNLYLADSGNNAIRMVAANTATYFGQSMTLGDIYTIAGNGTASYSGDTMPATSAELNDPEGVALDSTGNVYIADHSNNVVRMVAAVNGTYFGQSMTANDIYTIASGLSGPHSVAVDTSGNVFIADYTDHTIRMLSNTTGTLFGLSVTPNTLYTIAGSGTAGLGGTAGVFTLGTGLSLGTPIGVAVDSAGNVYFSDSTNLLVEKLFK